jgi:hypothetical protein
MKIERIPVSLFALLLLASVSVAVGQTNKLNNNRVTKAKPKQVTVTLVRWPFT